MQRDDAGSILAHAEFFDICNAEQRNLLAFASERHRHVTGAIVYKSGDMPEGAHILASGTLAAEPDTGEGAPYAITAPGTVISTIALVVAKPRPITIRATSPAETLLVPRRAFIKLLHQYPDLAARAAARIREELTSYMSAIETVKGRFVGD